jgi:hypothetical protein
VLPQLYDQYLVLRATPGKALSRGFSPLQSLSSSINVAHLEEVTCVPCTIQTDVSLYEAKFFVQPLKDCILKFNSGWQISEDMSVSSALLEELEVPSRLSRLAASRLAKREKSAYDKAEKQARREETLQQRLANLQLSNEQRIASKNQPKKSRKPRSQALHSGAATEQVERRVETEVPVPTSKVGRQLRRPQHLKNYQL